MAKARKASGEYVEIATEAGKQTAFIPYGLPPSLNLTRLQVALQDAAWVLGGANDLRKQMPETENFIAAYSYREAQFSSQIEGTRTDFAELFTSPRKVDDDLIETRNCLNAMISGVESIKSGRLPICNRLLRNSHATLMRDSKRGRNRQPGAFRRAQNYISAASRTIYVPPPANKVVFCMRQLEKFINCRSKKLPSLLKIGLAHAQFETIHPFLDGNGRLGRLLIIFMLVGEKLLEAPSIAPSLYLKGNKDRYYRLLQRVRTHSAWEDWLIFFLKAIETASKELTRDAASLKKLFSKDEGKIKDRLEGRRAVLAVFECFKRRPYLSVKDITEEDRSLSYPTANHSCKCLQELGIIMEKTARARNRVFAYPAYFKVLARGSDD